MSSFSLQKLVRKNIADLVPYSSARDEFKGKADVYLDANENSLGSPLPKWYHRYPDPQQKAIKQKLATIKKVNAEQILLGNGSDECIDLIFRCFCVPGVDNVIVCPPTYGMYQVSAHINDVQLLQAPLLPDYQLNLAHLETLVNAHTKVIWLCSPNNPTGNSLHRTDIEYVLNNFNGLVVIDEAYINFSKHKSWISELENYPNLIILQTLSKAWGLAGVRLGMLLASTDIVSILNKAKPPYNIPQPTQELVLKALDEVAQVNSMIEHLVDMRNALMEVFAEMPLVEKVYPSDANFFLVKMSRAREIYEYLVEQSIVVRDRSSVTFTENCLRITVGTEQENTKLVNALATWWEQNPPTAQS
ncbi:MAG: histidinol-phosphate transaminase [Bacteroidetes bacterium]|nr:MAG: histidinol-phosphate transaminase [Bacteroidota bacterium]TAE71441.1 MAG: histidinol-phosphate transaminase [Bacteroidota bacterium]TAF93718.1 MAG: histidinol-phosphate transaminase [Bacteroidota bacterium]